MKRWPQRRLGDLTDVLSGFAFDSEGFGDSGEMPVVRIRDVVPGSSSTFYRGAFDPRYIVSNGDILIGMDGEFNRARWRGGKALLNQRVSRIAPSCPDLDDGYLYYFLPAALKAIEQVTPFVTVKHLSVKQIRDISVPLPPIPDQRRIAEILDKADALRAKRRAALFQLDTLTQAIFLDMFGDPATNPKGWPELNIGDISEVKGGKRLPKGEEYSSTPTPYRYIRVTDLKAGKVDESALVYLKPEIQSDIARYVVHTGDVIISIAGSIGLVAPVPASLDGVNLTENAAKIVPRVRDRYDPVFLASFLSGAQAQGQIASYIGQVTIGKLALFRIEKIRVPLPPIERQRNFTRRVAAVEEQGGLQQMAAETADQLFSTLQHRAFEGEL